MLCVALCHSYIICSDRILGDIDRLDACPYDRFVCHDAAMDVIYPEVYLSCCRIHGTDVEMYHLDGWVGIDGYAI
jgi:hypothetical protein